MADLVELVPDVHHRLLRLQDAAQVDRGPAQDKVARGRVDRLLEFLDLLRPVAHRGQDLSRVRIFLVRLLDRADRVSDRADDLRRAETLRRNVGGPVLHAAMGERWTVFDRENALPANLDAVVRRDRRRGFDEDDVRVHAPDILLHKLDVLGRRRVDLVDHDDVGQADVRLAGIVRELVTWAERIRDDDEQVRAEERRIVVPAVPKEDLRLLLRLAEDLFVVYAGVDDSPLVDVGLVLFAFLDRGLVFVEVLVRRKALDRLGCEVAVRHRVSHDDDLLPVRAQDARDPPARLALS